MPKKPPLLRGERSKPWKSVPSLERSERSYPPSIPLSGAPKNNFERLSFFPYPFQMNPKSQKKPSLLKDFLSLNKTCTGAPKSANKKHFWKIFSLSIYPLLVHPKNTTFERFSFSPCTLYFKLVHCGQIIDFNQVHWGQISDFKMTQASELLNPLAHNHNKGVQPLWKLCVAIS